jgi:hypothetical protein
MVLAAPGPLLTPPPFSSPPKTPHQSCSAQTRSQNEEQNLPPKQYLPLQTRTRHRRSHRPHVPMLMRGTPPTMRSPPHQSRQTENPPNLQPATVGEEERGGRDPTSRRTSMRVASDCRLPPTARHASQPRIAPATPPSKRTQSTAAPLHGEGGQRRRRTAAPRHTAGCGPRPSPPPPPPAPPPQPHTTRPPPTTTRPEERRTSCRQQPAPPPRDAAKMSPRISIGPEPVLAAHAPFPQSAGSHCPAREGSALH